MHMSHHISPKGNAHERRPRGQDGPAPLPQPNPRSPHLVQSPPRAPRPSKGRRYAESRHCQVCRRREPLQRYMCRRREPPLRYCHGWRGAGRFRMVRWPFPQTRRQMPPPPSRQRARQNCNGWATLGGAARQPPRYCHPPVPPPLLPYHPPPPPPSQLPPPPAHSPLPNTPRAQGRAREGAQANAPRLYLELPARAPTFRHAARALPAHQARSPPARTPRTCPRFHLINSCPPFHLLHSCPPFHLLRQPPLPPRH
jgi:hypothetical protein